MFGDAKQSKDGGVPSLAASEAFRIVNEQLEVERKWWLEQVRKAAPTPTPFNGVVPSDPHWISYVKGFAAGVEALRGEIYKAYEEDRDA